MADAGPSLSIRRYRPTDEPEVVRLWRSCDLVVPWNDPHEDIAAKIAFQPDLFFIGEEDALLVATVMTGYEGHRGWVNYLAVSPDRRRRGIGRKMMEHAERTLRNLGCPKLNLQVRAGNASVLAFYRRLGFREDEAVSLGKRLDGKDWGFHAKGTRPES